jgi:uncharacterized protein DUF4115
VSQLPASAPDERRVLEELEQLQQAIRAARDHREQAKAAFAGQLRAFDPPVTPRATAPVETRANPPAPVLPPSPVLPSSTAFEPLPSLSRGPRDLFHDEISRREAPGATSKSAARWTMPALVTAAVVVAALALGWFWRRSPAAPVPTAPPFTETQALPSTGKPPVTPPPADTHALQLDLTTTRAVWLRVTADGKNILERELPAGDRRHFGADRTIVLRAGDAGAVRVAIGGVDQGPLGAEGQVVSRTYASAKPAAAPSKAPVGRLP